MTDAPADTAILLILCATRRAKGSIDGKRFSKWAGWRHSQWIAPGLAGNIFGVFGMGRIGLAAAARARAFGTSKAQRNRLRLAPAVENGARYLGDVDTSPSETDVLLIASPLSPDTTRFLNDQRIAMMP